MYTYIHDDEYDDDDDEYAIVSVASNIIIDDILGSNDSIYLGTIIIN